MHSCFTSCNFTARTLDFAVKFRLVFRYEAVVFRRYVLALLSVGLLRKFEAYLVYLSLIWTKNPRRFSFFQKFRHFTYILLWFHLVIPSFPARIDDMRSRFSALSTSCKPSHACAVKPGLLKSWTLEIDYSRAPCLGADQKTRGLWERNCSKAYFTFSRPSQFQRERGWNYAEDKIIHGALYRLFSSHHNVYIKRTQAAIVDLVVRVLFPNINASLQWRNELRSCNSCYS